MYLSRNKVMLYFLMRFKLAKCAELKRQQFWVKMFLSSVLLLIPCLHWLYSGMDTHSHLRVLASVPAPNILMLEN